MSTQFLKAEAMSYAYRWKSILETGSAVLVAIAAGALLWTLYRTPERAPAPVQNGTNRSRVESVSGLRIDGKKATKRIGKGPLAVVEFTDFQCPFCATYARDIYPSIRRDFIDKNKITYVSFAFPLERIHLQARHAGEVAECAARQGRYWEMHERLFAGQASLAERDFLVRSAVEVGLDRERLAKCIMNEAADAVSADIAEGARLMVRSTPTFFIGSIQPDGTIALDKRINGMAPLETFAEALAAVSKVVDVITVQ